MVIGEYGRVPGFGFLRLHSTYRHDLKIYASDEGRVQMTAAAFAKVFKHTHFSIQCVHFSIYLGGKCRPFS